MISLSELEEKYADDPNVVEAVRALRTYREKEEPVDPIERVFAAINELVDGDLVDFIITYGAMRWDEETGDEMHAIGRITSPHTTVWGAAGLEMMGRE